MQATYTYFNQSIKMYLAPFNCDINATKEQNYAIQHPTMQQPPWDKSRILLSTSIHWEAAGILIVDHRPSFLRTIMKVTPSLHDSSLGDILWIAFHCTNISSPLICLNSTSCSPTQIECSFSAIKHVRSNSFVILKLREK